MRIIRTPRIVMRPVREADARQLATLSRRSDMQEFQEIPILTQGELASRIARRPKRLDARAIGRFEWLMFIDGFSHPMGWVSLRIFDRVRNVGEIGYSIVTDFRHRGLATESAAGLVDTAFSVGALDRIEARCTGDNQPSRGVLERLGFARIESSPVATIVHGRRVTLLQFAVDAVNWRKSAVVAGIRRRTQS